MSVTWIESPIRVIGQNPYQIIITQGLCPSSAQWPLVPNFVYLDNVSFSFFIRIICWVTYILKVLGAHGPRQIFPIAQPCYRVLIFMIFDMFSMKCNPLKKISVL